jgi:hypothetical protein
MLSAITTATLARIAAISTRSKTRPAGVSLSKIDAVQRKSPAAGRLAEAGLGIGRRLERRLLTVDPTHDGGPTSHRGRRNRKVGRLITCSGRRGASMMPDGACSSVTTYPDVGPQRLT